MDEYAGRSLDERDSQGSWGHVKIQFRKEAVLEMGYTTPFAFTVGLMDKFIRGSELTPEVRLQSMIPAYRSFIFKGLEGYRKLLTLSVKSHLERPAGSKEAPPGFTEVRDEFLIFPTESGATAYATGIRPTGFWELKVPISVPLRLAENVSFPEILVDRYTDTNTNRSWEVLRPTHELQAAIESYARKSGLDLEHPAPTFHPLHMRFGWVYGAKIETLNALSFLSSVINCILSKHDHVDAAIVGKKFEPYSLSHKACFQSDSLRCFIRELCCRFNAMKIQFFKCYP